MVTIQKIIKEGLDILGDKDYLNPLLDVQLLLCYTLNVDKIYIYTHRDEVLDPEIVDKFYKLIEVRKKGYPLQYIIGHQEFMGLDFKVKEGVLVPRPDTEILVEGIIDKVNSGYFKNRDNVRILDIGTGSGAITLSLAYYIKNAMVYSIDISEDALKIAKENCENLDLTQRVTFLKGDLFKPLDAIKDFDKLDIIVSNPPYIPSKDIDHLQREVSQYEPRLALDGGVDGLDFYREIIDNSHKYLKSEGLLAFEIGYDQGKDLKKLLVDNKHFKNIEIKKDLSGHDRCVMAVMK